jgi:ATP-binding cassette, subfamily C (CFTR/MRP), member 1
MIDYSQPTAIPAIFSASLGLKVLILVLEEANKTSFIHDSVTAQGTAAEETAGIFSRTLFWWLNGLIWTGFSKVLHVETLPTIDQRLCSESLLARFSKRWEEGKAFQRHRIHDPGAGCETCMLTPRVVPKDGNNVLMITVFRSLLSAVLAPVIPLLCILALTVTQPLLLQTFLEFLSEPDDGTQEQMNRGWGLVAAYATVYISVAVRVSGCTSLPAYHC